MSLNKNSIYTLEDLISYAYAPEIAYITPLMLHYLPETTPFDNKKLIYYCFI